MDIQEIFSLQLYKFPYTTKFKLNSNAEALLYVAASVTPNGRSGLVGVNVKVDGKQVASPQVFSNEIGSTRATVAELARIPTGFGERTLTLEAATGSTSIGPHDYACGTVFYRGVVVRTDARAAGRGFEGQRSLTEAATGSTSIGPHDYACGTVFYRGAVEPFIWRFQGPVPKSKKFKSVMSGTAVLYLAGSAFIKEAKVCGLSVLLDGKEVARSQFKPSINNSHFAVPAIFVPVQLRVKEYEIGVSTTLGEMSSDANDWYEVGIIY